jgi:IclR family acetate operon transcriptional repressor
VDREENEPGVACVGAPIFDEKGAAIAALSVSGPVGRMLKQEREIGSILAAICGEISRNLGLLER